MITLSIYILFTSALTGAMLCRWRGSKEGIQLPRPLEQMLYCSVFLAAMVILQVPVYLHLPAYAISVVFCLMGHGPYFLDRMVKAFEREWPDFILNWFYGTDPRSWDKFKQWRDFDRETATAEQQAAYDAAMTDIQDEMEEYGMDRLYRRCVAGMALTGMLVSIAPGLATMSVSVPAGIGIALSGALAKGNAYHWAFKWKFGTEGGEYGNGGLQWAFVAAITMAALVVHGQ